MKIFILALLSCLFISCGKNASFANFETPSDLIDAYTAPVKDGVKELPYTYELDDTSNGTYCTTGYHEFSTLQDTCKALLNDSLNKSCARDKRVNLYNISDCDA